MTYPKLASASLLTLLFTPLLINAQSLNPFTVNGSIGYLFGESKEFVFDDETQQKISQLNWKIESAAVIQGEANYQLLSWLDVNAQGYTTLGQGNALMDDYDWLGPNPYQWSDWSNHPDSDLRYANQFDVNLRGWFLQKHAYKLGGILGYQRTVFSFLAKGGCFSYNNASLVGCFPDGEIGIGYKQEFSAPYLGLVGNYVMNAWEFNGLFQFSNQVDASDIDQHYARDLTFREKGSQFDYYHAMINAGYYVQPQIKFFVQGALTYFPNNKASTEILDYSTGEQVFAPVGAAGLQNQSYVVAFGVQYKGPAPQQK